MYHIFAKTPIWRTTPKMADGGTAGKKPGKKTAADLDREEDEDFKKSGLVPVSKGGVKKDALFFQEGTSDKEYHLELAEASGKYVVNFKYGRRGSNLKEGTKTPSPVSLEEAEKIYAKYLKEKTREGYHE